MLTCSLYSSVTLQTLKMTGCVFHCQSQVTNRVWPSPTTNWGLTVKIYRATQEMMVVFTECVWRHYVSPSTTKRKDDGVWGRWDIALSLISTYVLVLHCFSLHCKRETRSQQLNDDDEAMLCNLKIPGIWYPEADNSEWKELISWQPFMPCVHTHRHTVHIMCKLGWKLWEVN